MGKTSLSTGDPRISEASTVTLVYLSWGFQGTVIKGQLAIDGDVFKELHVL